MYSIVEHIFCQLNKSILFIYSIPHRYNSRLFGISYLPTTKKKLSLYILWYTIIETVGIVSKNNQIYIYTLFYERLYTLLQNALLIRTNPNARGTQILHRYQNRGYVTHPIHPATFPPSSSYILTPIYYKCCTWSCMVW